MIAIFDNSDMIVRWILSIVLAKRTSSAARVALPFTFSSYPRYALGILRAAKSLFYQKRQQ